MTTLLGFFAAGVELAGILPFLLSHSSRNGGEGHAAPEGYLLAMAILSAVGLGLGVLRHYWDIYIHRSVRGISFLFVFLDAAGDLTSLLSVGESLPPCLWLRQDPTTREVTMDVRASTGPASRR